MLRKLFVSYLFFLNLSSFCRIPGRNSVLNVAKESSFNTERKATEDSRQGKNYGRNRNSIGGFNLSARIDNLIAGAGHEPREVYIPGLDDDKKEESFVVIGRGGVVLTQSQDDNSIRHVKNF